MKAKGKKKKTKAKSKSTPKKTGRPTKYSEEIGNEICRQLMEGKSLRQICDSDKVAPLSTVIDWLNTNELFNGQYRKAREVQAELYFDELIAISDNVLEQKEAVEKARLRSDNRKWALARMNPKVYGEKKDVKVEVSGIANRLQKARERMNGDG